jgi:glycosyltransferase involved in cell wall biosynthesis
MNMSTVAIIMTTYNGEKYVKEQLDSILASTYQDFEIFVWDDGSRDNTLDILNNYSSLYPAKIRVFRNETNLGVTGNFLQALCRNTMDYIMFCDQDDVWKPNKTALTLRRMRHMEGQAGKDTPIAVFTDATVVDQDMKVLKSSFFCSNHLNPKKTDLPHILMENKLIGCTVMVNSALRKVLHCSRLPKYAKFHDWWIALIAASMGKIGFVNEGTLFYRQHSSNVVGGSGFLPYIKNRLTYFHAQKESLFILRRQAEEFLEIYRDQLSEENREIIRCFSQLDQYDYITRRRIILHCGYLKTGIIRNTGLMIII